MKKPESKIADFRSIEGMEPIYPPEELEVPENIFHWDELFSFADTRPYFRQRLGPLFRNMPRAVMEIKVYEELVSGKSQILIRMLLEEPEAGLEFRVVYFPGEDEVHRVSFLLSIESPEPAEHMLAYLRKNAKTRQEMALLEGIQDLSDRASKLHWQWVRDSEKHGLSKGGRIYYKVPLKKVIDDAERVAVPA